MIAEVRARQAREEQDRIEADKEKKAAKRARRRRRSTEGETTESSLQEKPQEIPQLSTEKIVGDDKAHRKPKANKPAKKKTEQNFRNNDPNFAPPKGRVRLFC